MPRGACGHQAAAGWGERRRGTDQDKPKYGRGPLLRRAARRRRWKAMKECRGLSAMSAGPAPRDSGVGGPSGLGVAGAPRRGCRTVHARRDDNGLELVGQELDGGRLRAVDVHVSPPHATGSATLLPGSQGTGRVRNLPRFRRRRVAGPRPRHASLEAAPRRCDRH